MPLDKVLINHLDEMDLLENAIEDDIEEVLRTINIKKLMKDPEGTMLAVAKMMQQILEEDYYTEATKNGITFAKNIVEDGDIRIQRSKDPNLNE